MFSVVETQRSVAELLSDGSIFGPKPPPCVSSAELFLFATVSPQLAVLFTNPFDTAKVRLQLQKGRAGVGEALYRNSLDCMVKIAKNEGVLALQKGIVPALYREGSKNVFRIGMFEPIMQLLHDPNSEPGPVPMWKRVIAGATSGAMGAFACNPFELIKTRMQAFASKGAVSVGEQHAYRGMFHAFASVIRGEGIRSLYKGSSMSMLRSIVGSGTNLASYSWMREKVLENQWMKNNSFTDATCSLVSSFITAFLMNPVDVLRTRIYNSGANGQYKNGLDALLSLLKHEGPRALFKGFFPSFVRLGPHFTLTFVFLEQMKRLDLRYKDYQYDNTKKQALEELFKRVDQSGDGLLNVDEVRDMLRIAFPPTMAPHLSETQYAQLLEEDTLELFRQCDADCSGNLDIHEFLKISNAMEKILHDHNLKAAFAFFDTDHNGRIEVQEFVEILKTMGHRPEGVSEEEFDEAIQQDVMKLMSYLDHDHRGYLDYEAFSRLCPKLGAVQGKRLLKEWIHDSGLHTLD